MGTSSKQPTQLLALYPCLNFVLLRCRIKLLTSTMCWQSFVLPLNPPVEYEGGGTQFVNLEGKPVFRPDHEGSVRAPSGLAHPT